MESKKHLILLGGPTASGKTKLAIQLAHELNTEVINADSRQFYQQMRIGTAVPSEEELAAVPHHFIQSHDAAQPLSAADYETQALPLIKSLFKEKDILVVCGGSGLYLQALAEGLDPLPPADLEYRRTLEDLFKSEGVDALAALLKEKAPEKAENMDLKNPRRVIRALEIIHAGPVPESDKKKEPREFNVIPLFLNLDRETLYSRIDNRVDEMMEEGLLAEVQELLPLRESAALQTVGYRELFDHIDGLYSLDEAVDKIKQHTRNYAKRQLTWFRNKGNYQEVSELPSALEVIKGFLTPANEQ